MEEKINEFLQTLASAFRIWLQFVVTPWRTYKLVTAPSGSAIAAPTMLLGAALLGALVFERTALDFSEGVEPAEAVARIADQLGRGISWEGLLGSFAPLLLTPVIVGTIVARFAEWLACRGRSATTAAGGQVRDLHLYTVASYYVTFSVSVVATLVALVISKSLDAAVTVLMVAASFCVWSVIGGFVAHVVLGFKLHAETSLDGASGFIFGALALATVLISYALAASVESIGDRLDHAVRVESARFPGPRIDIVDHPVVIPIGRDSLRISWGWLYSNPTDTLLVVNGRINRVSCGYFHLIPVEVVRWSGGDGYAALTPGATAWMQLEMRIPDEEYVLLRQEIVKWSEENTVPPCRAEVSYAGAHRGTASGVESPAWGLTTSEIHFRLDIPVGPLEAGSDSNAISNTR